ncbi:MAG TPA: RDD family protein [Rhodanobacteraceae bacterium]
MADTTSADGLPMLPAHRDEPRLHAGFWRRAVALLIDCLVFSAIHWIIVLCFGIWIMVPWALLGGGHGPAMAELVDIALQPFGIVVVWLYFAVCESSRWRATLGKLALGLQVTDEYGRRIGFARASGRYFGKFVSVFTLGIGFLLAAWTARRQALHDSMAGCCVVRRAGLAEWQDGQAASLESTRSPPPASGLPGWGIALVVIGACVFLVLPVTGFLAAFAIPAWQSHALRTEVAQGLELTERARALVGEYIGERGALPENNRVLGLPKPEAIQARYVTSVRVAGGKVVVTYGNEANAVIRGGHVVISPMGNAARLHWRCSSADIDARYLPRQCQP